MSEKFSFAERIRQDILLFTVDEEFLSDAEAIRSKYNLPLKSEELNEFEDPLIYSNKNYKKDLLKLREKYIIPESHHITLESYIIYGYVSSQEDGIADELWHLNPNAKTEETLNCIELKIYPDTTLKDIQENWPRIKTAKDKLLQRDVAKKVRIENLDRDLEIFQLKKQGKNSKEIASLINKDKRFNEVLLGYEDIPKIMKRLKDMSKRNMASKES